MRKIALLACAMLAGCAAQVISTSERTVMVQARIQDAAQAQALADAECRKHGRAARLSMKATDQQYVFDCVQ